MCLLVVLSRTRPEVPLLVAANRDELLERPALPMTVLAGDGPRVLGGRDELAGGTWLAVNEDGVVAGLTNRPVEGGRDPAKRSRGELPLVAARRRSAAAAVAALQREIDPTRYNPAWMLVGDRVSLFAVDVSGHDAVRVEELPPGLHVLENRPFGQPSPTVRHVQAMLADESDLSLPELTARLRSVLGDHEVPGGDEADLPAQVRANCVHADGYGTRWSCLARVPATADPPALEYADGPPCTSPFADASALWFPGGGTAP